MVLLDAVPSVRLGSAFGALMAASAYTTTNSRIRSIPSTVKNYAGSNRRARFGSLGVTVSLAIVLSLIGDNVLSGDPDPPLSTHTGFNTGTSNINISQRDIFGKHIFRPLSVTVTAIEDFGQGDSPGRSSFGVI